MQIAVYGKGGIGKSTVSANLSAALAYQGCKVLQVGCDPKHDSTRLLHHGQKVKTILEYLLNTPVDEQKAEDVLIRGYMECGCVEAGGPRPGMGCAGRGILTSFDFLEKFNVIGQYDTVIYDVLGDVVCGGFAVPVRKKYADAVFLVTSGEAMAIYAANNILHGIKNLDPERNRIAGIIYNSRGIGDEAERVYAFAKAVGLPICAELPRSEAFLTAERKALTQIEMNPESRESRSFLQLADQISDDMVLYDACPLEEEDMERFMRGDDAYIALDKKDERGINLGKENVQKKTATPMTGGFVPAKKRALSDPFSRVPLFGCAFNGALALAIHLKDCAVLAHAPKSCVWYSLNGFTGYSRRGFYDRGILYPAFIPRNFEATDINGADAVFGGVEHAREKAMKLFKRGAKTIIAVTACIPGMSGDDLSPVKQELKALGCDMIIVRTDGVEVGDYNEGMAFCYRTIAKEAVLPDAKKEADSINLVYEKTWSAITDLSFEEIDKIFKGLGLRVNCRFVCATTIEAVRNFMKAPYSILVQSDSLGQEIKKVFTECYHADFLKDGLPRGFEESARFVRMLGTAYHKEKQAEKLIHEQRKLYESALMPLREVFSGKRTLVYLTNQDYDWLYELFTDLELDILESVTLGEKKDGNAGWNRRFSDKWEDDVQRLNRMIRELKPEIIFVNDYSAIRENVEEGIVIHVDRETVCGFFSGISVASEWEMSLEQKREGRWKNDRQVFEKYYC